MIGIYKIENTINGKVYIGQSIHIKLRWSEHKAELRGGYHDNSHLQLAWNKYGEEAFIFSILETFDDISILNSKEKYWINYYNSFNKNKGYNLTYGGDGNRKYSDEDFYLVCELFNSGITNPVEISKITNIYRKTIERWLHTATDNNICNYDANKSKCEKVICLNNFEVFDSVFLAQDYYHINGVASCCNHKTKYAGKNNNGEPLLWMHLKEYENYSKEEIDKYIDELQYKIREKYVICLNNKFVFENTIKAINWANLKTPRSIWLCCNNKAHYAGIDKNGVPIKWIYYKDYIKKNDTRDLIFYQVS